MPSYLPASPPGTITGAAPDDGPAGPVAPAGYTWNDPDNPNNPQQQDDPEDPVPPGYWLGNRGPVEEDTVDYFFPSYVETIQDLLEDDVAADATLPETDPQQDDPNKIDVGYFFPSYSQTLPDLLDPEDDLEDDE
jgi:hypothetical protein